MNLLDIFEGREPYQQAIDKLEQRRIEDLEARMDDCARRGDKEGFQKCKAERDSYHKVKMDEGSMKQWLWNEAERMDRDAFVGNADEYGMTAEEAAEWWDDINGVDEASIGQDLVNKTEKMARATPPTPAGKVASTVKNAAKWLAGKGGPGREGPTYEQEELDEKLKGLPTKKLGSARDLGKSVRKFRSQRGLEEAGTDSQWSKESDWKAIPKAKSGRPVDPRGEVAHLSDVARRETERKSAQKKNSKEVKEENSKPRDLAAAVMLKKARAAFPSAQDDAEALALWIAAKEQRDVDHLEHENEQEEEMIARIMDQLKKTNVDEAEQQLAIASKYTGDGQFQITVNNKHKYIVTVAGFEIDPLDTGILDSFYLTDAQTGKTKHVASTNSPLEDAIYEHLWHNQRPALKKIYAEDMAFYDEHGWNNGRPDRLEGLPLTGWNATPATDFIGGYKAMKRATGQDVDEEQKPLGFGEFPPKQEIKIDPPRKLKSGQTYQDQNKYWQAQGQAPIYKTNEGDQIRLGDVQPGTAGYDAWSKSTHKTGEPGKKPQPANKSDYDWTEKQKIMPKVLPEAGSPAQQAAIAIAMKKAHKKPKSVDEETTRLDPKCWTGKKIGSPKTKVKGGVRVNNCVPAEESYTGVMESQGITDPKLLEVARKIDAFAKTIK
jgi:hypothetical protein